MKSEIIERVKYTKEDFLIKAEIDGFSVYESGVVEAYAAKGKELMKKAETDELSDDENHSLAEINAELSTLKPEKVLVFDENTKKSREETLYYR